MPEQEASSALSKQHRRSSFNTCASVSTTSTVLTSRTDLSVSDEVFSYQNGTIRGVLAGLSRRFLRGPLCKLMRRPSFPHHVIPTSSTSTAAKMDQYERGQQRPPLIRDETPPW